MLASMTSALPGIPFLLAGCPSDSLVLLDQLVFGGAPGSDHFVQVFRRGAHSLQFGFSASFLRRNVKAEGLAVAHDRQRRSGFEVAGKVLAEFAHPDFNRFHIAYSLYTF